MRLSPQRWIIVATSLLSIIISGIVLFRLVTKHKNTANEPKTSATAATTVDDQPLMLESVGFNLDYYDPKTNRAGDMEFTNVDHDLSGHVHQIWQDFGQQDYRSPNDPTKKNP